MTEPRLGDVLRDAGVPDLVEILSERLTQPELETVLLEAYRQRVGRVMPPDLLEQYQREQRVQPSLVRASVCAEIDAVARWASAPPFELLELSPICPSGTIAVVAPVDPGAASSVGSSSEVVSSCVSVLALECARRRQDSAAGPLIRLSASHRELHAPYSAQLRSEPHARVFALCSAGAAEEDLRFVTDNLVEQLRVHLQVVEQLRRVGHRIGVVRVALFVRSETDLYHVIPERVFEPLFTAFPGVRLALDPDRSPGQGYYAPLSFTVAVEDQAEVEHRIGLGGFTDWTRQLLGRGTERLLVSVIAIEQLGEVFGPSEPERIPSRQS